MTTGLLACTFALVYALTRGHAPADYDAVNFLLGVRDFDLGRHQPHPPGAPAFIAAGKALVWLGLSPLAALIALSITGAMLFVAVWHRMLLLVLAPGQALAAVVLLGLTPAIWLSATQPMSDTLAVSAVAAVQWQVLWYDRTRQPRHVWLAVLFAVLALGVRPQFGVFIIAMFCVSACYLRLPIPLLVRAVGWFFVLNLLWLLPVVVAQAQQDGGNWFAYFKHIVLFYGEFSEASGSPVLASSVDVLHVGERVVAHVGSMGYFGAGLNLWYPESVAERLASFGSQRTPIHADLQEWSFAGSVFLVFYLIGAVCVLPRLRSALQRREAQLLALAATCYAVTVLLLVPPHTRFYLPLLPLLVLVPVAGLGRSQVATVWRGAVCVVAIAALVSVVQDARQQVPPPLALAYDVVALSEASSVPIHAVLDSNGRRHVQLLAPAVPQARRTEDTRDRIESWIDQGVRVVVSSPASVAHLGDRVRVELVGEYRSALRVWMRHTGAQLYEVIPVEHTATTDGGSTDGGANAPPRARAVLGDG
ncbi:MAG: hypothetical protein AAGA11_11025 [Pseudomonadota bacterium]